MVAVITPGLLFQQGGGQTYTASQFNSFLSDATISGIDRTNMASTARPVTVAASEPSNPQTGELWYDTTESQLKAYDGSAWNVVSFAAVYTATSTIDVGDVVVIDTAANNSVKTSTVAAGLERVVGIALSAATSGNPVIVHERGKTATVNCTSAAVSVGDRLVKATTAGLSAASSTASAYGVALSSKGSGGVGSVSAYLFGGDYQNSSQSAAFATYSMTATLTNSTWYDFPNAALGAVTAPTAGGSTSMKVEARTTRPGQVLTLTITGLDIRTDDVNDFFKGFRLVAQDSALSDTVIMGSTTKGAAFSDADGEQEYHACGAIVYRITSILVGVSVPGASITFTLPTVDTYTIRPQFQASNAGSTSYSITNVTAATLLAVVH